MGFNLETLAAARGWDLTVFTTYSLSLSFFEGIVLDRLARNSTKETLIISDAEGIRSSLHEHGAQRVGRDYEVEPVSLESGVFHPKLSLFHSADDTHLVCGSGNLTFGGWGRNLEVINHLHPSFAQSAFEDAATFFECLAQKDSFHDLRERCNRIAEILLQAALNGQGEDIRLLHGFAKARPIGHQIAELCDSLGGATAITVASAFWDQGAAADRLCRDLGLERMHIHAHPKGVVMGTRAKAWPFNATVDVCPVHIQSLAADERPLHAKVMEIICRNGRLTVSGSANATSAALYGGNVEACVARIYSEPKSIWTISPAVAPIAPEVVEEDVKDPQSTTDVLRAVLESDQVVGRVLSASFPRKADLYHVHRGQDVFVGPITLDPNGRFTHTVDGLESLALEGSRVTLKLKSAGRTAEGFVSVILLNQLNKLAGKVTRHIMAILNGTEVPDDVRVLLEWAKDNPDLFASSTGGGWSVHTDRQDSEPSLISTADLEAAEGDPGESAVQQPPVAWQNFVHALLAALRRKEPRTQTLETDGDEENAVSEDPDDDSQAQIRRKISNAITAVVEALCREGAPPDMAFNALDLAQYALKRLGDKVDPDYIKGWLTTGVAHLTKTPIHIDHPRFSDLVGAICCLEGQGSTDQGIWARIRLQKIGVNFAKPFKPTEWILPFADAVGVDVEEIWTQAAASRTWREQAGLYLDALEARVPGTGYEQLLSKLPAEAKTLRDAITSDAARRRIVEIGAYTTVCVHHKCRTKRTIPAAEQRLNAYGVAMTDNCCQKILIWPEQNRE